MQVGASGTLPNVAFTLADESKSAASARPPESTGSVLPALEEVEIAQRSLTDERQNTKDEERDKDALAQEQRIKQRQEIQQEQAKIEEIRALAQRDREVKAHEQAHQSVGGAYAGSASYTYTTGPNGVRYAVSGEVPIDLSRVPNDPEATLQKANTVERAALAPAEPSAQDRQVAAQAVQLALEARSEIQQLIQEARNRTNEAEFSTSTDDEASFREADSERSSETENDSLENDNEQQTTALADATERLIELNEDLSRIYEQLLQSQNFEDNTLASRNVDINA